jgi:RNA polymerase primary sigma factor
MKQKKKKDTSKADAKIALALKLSEEKVIMRKAKLGDESARAAILKAYQPFVASIARKYHNYFHWMEFEELLDEGNFGLLQAIDHYNPDRNIRFTTYSWFWIVKKVQDYVTKLLVFLKVPDKVLKNLRKINKIFEKSITHNIHVKLDDITKEMDIEMDELRELLSDFSAKDTPFSLDKYIDGDEERNTLKDVLPDDEESMDFSMDKGQLKDKIGNYIDMLGDDEARVIRLRFGFEDSRYHSLADVAKKMDIASQKVKDIEFSALAKLKIHLVE